MINTLGSLSLVLFVSFVHSTGAIGQVIPLDGTDDFRAINVMTDAVEFKGKQALHVTEVEEPNGPAKLLVLEDYEFHNGTINLDIAGEPRVDAGAGARGFVGLAFRVDEEASNYECFYLRPTNARANDQLRRNHTLQYVSEPEWPWHRFRQETPGKYESYADMLPAEWTAVKIVVEGETAQLYVDDADQPALIVNDLKRGDVGGGIALWIGPGTNAYFANLVVEKD